MNRVTVTALAVIAFAVLAGRLHETLPAEAAPSVTYDFKLVTAGTSTDYLLRALNDIGSQGYHAVGLVCLGNTNQFAGNACVPEILMERERR